MPPDNTQTLSTNTSTNPAGTSNGQPTPSQTPFAPPPSSKSKWPLIVAIAAVVLIVAGAAIYFFVIKPNGQSADNSSQSSSDTQKEASASTVTSITTTDSPNNANGTISFTHPSSWQVTKETDQYGAENTIIKSPLGNAVKMYRRDSVGGACEDDTNTYTLVKKIPTQNSSYIFSEYKVPQAWGPEVLSLEPNYDQKSATHKALTEGQSNTNLCQNLSDYPIAKDINVTIENSAGKEAQYNDIKNDTEFMTMLQSFNVADN